jgi:hypothetical protein
MPDLRELRRENAALRAANIDLMEMLAEQEYHICLVEMGVNYDL